MAIKRSVVLTIIIVFIAAGAASLYGISREAKLGVYHKLETLTTPDVISEDYTPLTVASEEGLVALENAEQKSGEEETTKDEIASELKPAETARVPGEITLIAMRDESKLDVVNVSPTVTTGASSLFIWGIIIAFGLGCVGLIFAPILAIRR